MIRARLARRIVALGAVAAVAAGCVSETITGQGSTVYDDPDAVLGIALRATDSGPKPGADDPTLTLRGPANTGSGGEVDDLVELAITDIMDFWQAQIPREFGYPDPGVDALFSWDARLDAPQGMFCGDSDFAGFVNAMYCPSENTIGWDRGVMLPMVQRGFGTMAVVSIMAHEYGHHLQVVLNTAGAMSLSIVAEQQADCFAGVYIRHVAEGDSARFGLDPGAGLDEVVASMLAVRDTIEPGAESGEFADDEHGNGFERVAAFQIGFALGAHSCGNIGRSTITEAREGIPEGIGGADYDADDLDAIFAALDDTFPMDRPPTLRHDNAGGNNAGGGSVGGGNGCAANELASFCPADNTVTVADDSLTAFAQDSDADTAELPGNISGAFAAYSVVVSRYLLGYLAEQGFDADLPLTGLRAACLTGAWARTAEDVPREAYSLDEAISQLINTGDAAQGAAGRASRSGFVRADAFRFGVLHDQAGCADRFSD